MQKMLIGIFVCLLVGTITSCAFAEDRTRSYDSSGKVTSTGIRSGNTIRYYDPEGHLILTDTIYNGYVDHYDAQGKYIGRSYK